MYTPDPQDPEFGSELLKRESPKLRAARRRSQFWSAVMLFGLGVFSVWLGVDAIHDGHWVKGPNSSRSFLPDSPGEVWCLMGAGLIAAAVWMLYRLRGGKAYV